MLEYILGFSAFANLGSELEQMVKETTFYS